MQCPGLGPFVIKNLEVRVLDQTSEFLAPTMARVYMSVHGELPKKDFAGAQGALHRHLRAHCCCTCAAVFDIKALVSVPVNHAITARGEDFGGTGTTAVSQANSARLSDMSTVAARTGIDLGFQNMRGDVDTKFVRVDQLLALEAFSFIRVAD